MKKAFILGTGFCYRDDQWPITRVTLHPDAVLEPDHKKAYVVFISITFAGLEVTEKLHFYVDKDKVVSDRDIVAITLGVGEWIFANFKKIMASELEKRVLEITAHSLKMYDPDAVDQLRQQQKEER